MEENPLTAGLWVIRRFLRAYGPSTPAEFGRWFALEPALVKQLFAALEDELVMVDVEGEKRRLLSGDQDGFEPAPKAVHLLPHFDVYVVGSHPRAQLIPPRHRPGRARHRRRTARGAGRRPSAGRLATRAEGEAPADHRRRPHAARWSPAG